MGPYTISVLPQLPIVNDSSDLSNLTFESAFVDSFPITLNLSQSNPLVGIDLTKRTWSGSNCAQKDKEIVTHTLQLAKQYARFGVSAMNEVINSTTTNRPHPLWNLYFNNDDTGYRPRRLPRINELQSLRRQLLAVLLSTVAFAGKAV